MMSLSNRMKPDTSSIDFKKNALLKLIDKMLSFFSAIIPELKKKGAK